MNTNDRKRMPEPTHVNTEGLKPQQSAGVDPIEAIFGVPISTYTRKQAIEDGVLVDVSGMARETGFRIPVAMTIAAWEDCVAWTDADSRRQTHQDQSGRLGDVLWMAWLAARNAPGRAACVFTLHRVPRGGRGYKPRAVLLKLVCGPGDEGEPVATIMLPDED